jgi:hypothetical protein
MQRVAHPLQRNFHCLTQANKRPQCRSGCCTNGLSEDACPHKTMRSSRTGRDIDTFVCFTPCDVQRVSSAHQPFCRVCWLVRVALERVARCAYAHRGVGDLQCNPHTLRDGCCYIAELNRRGPSARLESPSKALDDVWVPTVSKQIFMWIA